MKSTREAHPRGKFSGRYRQNFFQKTEAKNFCEKNDKNFFTKKKKNKKPHYIKDVTAENQAKKKEKEGTTHGR